MVSGSIDERFEIVARLGSGSFGVVYEAFDRYRHRSVALKVLERALPDSIARFKREFRFLADVRHPNVISLYELLMLGDRWALSMELVKGSELLEHLVIAELQNALVEARGTQEATFDSDATLRWRPKRRMRGVSAAYFEQVRQTFRQLALAIAVLHAHGILHRDIKPSNIMITEGRVVLLDFGLVVEIERDDSIDRNRMVGTPGYMAPEQISASTPSVASDWYSFGVLLYQALTGQMPFTAATPLEVLEMQVQADAPPAMERLPGIPEDLASLADDCIRRDPQQRPNVSDVLRRLEIEDFDIGRTERNRVRRRNLLGRSRELKTMWHQIAGVEPGKPLVLGIAGSPGSGKTALLDLVLDRARTEGMFLVGGECQVWESVPFNAVDVLVDSVARELRRARPFAVDEVLSRAVAVTQMFPALLPVGGVSEIAEETVAVPPTGAKLLALAASELRSIIFAAAGDRPVLIFLDNAQWGDYESADVVRRLLAPTDGRRVVVLFTYRSEDWRSGLMLQWLVGCGVKIEELVLKDLTRAMTKRMIMNATGHQGTRLLDQVYRTTRGNAALVEMAIDTISRRDDRASLSRAIASRLEHLSAPAHQLFTFLLRYGQCYEYEAAEMLELVELDEPLRTLRNERLIRVLKSGDLRALDIYHPRLREVLGGVV